jgi:F-type H+-transporting ATPase subunit a
MAAGSDFGLEVHPSMWAYLIKDLLGLDYATIAHYDHVISALMVAGICTVMALAIRSRLNLIPGGFQQVIEVLLLGLQGMIKDNIGHQHTKKYMPLVGTLAFFIFISNFLGLLPSFSAPTANFNTTIGCALVVFIYYNYEGLRENGGGYFKHFVGPIPWLAPIMIPIEIVSHLARPFSLGIRVFGNISGEHVVVLVFYSLVPLLVPMPIMIIGLFAAILQTFVFVMLTQIYIAGAIAHDH